MTDRIQKIIQIYEADLFHKLSQCEPDIALDSVWSILISADPSPNKKNVRWLVETYINNGFLWEDIVDGKESKVAETLVEFDKHKRNLETSERSLNKYRTLGDLWNAIKPFIGQLTANEDKREERDKAYTEAEVIVDRADGFKVISPKTEYAAKWFGRGTRWCTASENNNMFYRYTKYAPLFIIFMPNGDKLQLWKKGRSSQFMNENDVIVSKDYSKQYWNILEPIISYLNDVRYFPDEYITNDWCLEAVKRNVDILQFIPENRQTYEVCEKAIQYNRNTLKYIPKKMKDKEICLKAVIRSYGEDLIYVPDELKDYNICMEAVKQNGSALKYVPDRFKTYELCLNAMRSNVMSIEAILLENIPDEFRDYNMYMAAVKKNGDVLQFIPEDKKTKELCEFAVESNFFSIKYVPAEYIDYRMCLSMVQKSGWALRLVPEKYKDYNICLESLKERKHAWDFIPDDIKTRLIHNKKHDIILDATPLENIQKPTDKISLIMDEQISQMKKLFKKYGGHQYDN